jgi:hypothetical protein
MEDILNKITTFEKAKQEWTEKGDLKMAAQFERGIKALKTKLTSAASDKPIEKLSKTASLGVARNSSLLAGNLDSDPNGSCWDTAPNSTIEKNIGGSKSEKLHTEKSPAYIEAEKFSPKKTYTSWQLKENADFKEYQAIVNGIRESIRVMLKFPNCDKEKKRREISLQLDYARYWINENFLEGYKEMAFKKKYKIKDRFFVLDKETTIKEYFKEDE